MTHNKIMFTFCDDPGHDPDQGISTDFFTIAGSGTNFANNSKSCHRIFIIFI